MQNFERESLLSLLSRTLTYDTEKVNLGVGFPKVTFDTIRGIHQACCRAVSMARPLGDQEVPSAHSPLRAECNGYNKQTGEVKSEMKWPRKTEGGKGDQRVHFE